MLPAVGATFVLSAPIDYQPYATIPAGEQGRIVGNIEELGVTLVRFDNELKGLPLDQIVVLAFPETDYLQPIEPSRDAERPTMRLIAAILAAFALCSLLLINDSAAFCDQPLPRAAAAPEINWCWVGTDEDNDDLVWTIRKWE